MPCSPAIAGVPTTPGAWRSPTWAVRSTRSAAIAPDSSAPPATWPIPAALREGAPLSARLGAGLDPCAALQTRIELPPDTQIDVLFLLGDAASAEEAQALIEPYRDVDLDAVLADVGNQWNGLLDTVQVSTPDRAMDLMLNHWLPYQVLASRVWARTAYYQSSGAFGYRDQLQDVMALCVSRPDLAREHLLRAAGRQFAEGDVQHWWLPPTGAGIRTRIRDDRVWLAYVASHYADVSGDHAVHGRDVAVSAGAVDCRRRDRRLFPADPVATRWSRCTSTARWRWTAA